LVVIAVLIGLGVLASLGGHDTPKANNPCQSDWSKCTDNADVVNHYSDWISVQAACKIAATHQAKYGSPTWPWGSFGSFFEGNSYVTSGIAVAVEPDAQFSNGFGAMVHSKVICTYDLRAKKVISASISEAR
jgi:hypothetical protein